MVKSPLEVACVRRAAASADEAMLAVRQIIAPGMTEIEVQSYVEYIMVKLGGEPAGIRTAIRSGPRGAAHHAPPFEYGYLEACSRQIRGAHEPIVSAPAHYTKRPLLRGSE